MEPVKPLDASAVSKAKAFVIRQMEMQPQPSLMFHNLKHTTEVAATAYRLGQMENLSSSDLVLLQVAAWFHDLGYLSSYIGHEESSAGMAQEFLEELQMPNDGIQRVMDLIAATKFNQIPETELEKERFAAALRRKQLSLVLAGKMKPHEATELKALFV